MATWFDKLTEGVRYSPEIDIENFDEIYSSLIEWEETLNGKTLTIETSVDNGDTWQECSNGEEIPNIDETTDIVSVRQIFNTDEIGTSPRLEKLYIEIEGLLTGSVNVTGNGKLSYTDYKLISNLIEITANGELTYESYKQLIKQLSISGNGLLDYNYYKQFSELLEITGNGNITFKEFLGVWKDFNVKYKKENNIKDVQKVWIKKDGEWVETKRNSILVSK